MAIRLQVIAALLISLLVQPAMAQTRFVFVNGQRMTDQQISQLEFFACTAIPNGSYWLNLNNGAWGYAGNWQVQGIFGDQCNVQAQRQRKSLSERGMLYSPGEILRGSP
jgi:hypothetical protein